MSILIDENTKVLVQGITGREGSARTRTMLDYGTKVLCGVTPGRGGTFVWGVPVYNTVKEAINLHGELNASVTFVPGPEVKDAVVEAIESGIRFVVVPAERVPLHDSLEMIALARRKNANILGPGSLGLISAEKSLMGWIGGSADFAREIFKSGNVGVMSRSGGQTTTVAWSLTQNGLGLTTAMHVGAEPVLGLAFPEILPLFQADPDTHAVVMFGEIGTVAEEEAAEVIREGRFKKPLVAYIAGRSLPAGVRFSHASAIIERGRGTAESKIKALEDADATVVDRPQDIATTIHKLLRA
ncbi:MAG TPA: CoA-binding protein [Candidatus Dormibacteraeota bacterium]|nr:CoA-binding protein [Candidatus Dormibacteraeota bacterium]